MKEIFRICEHIYLLFILLDLNYIYNYIKFIYSTIFLNFFSFSYFTILL